MMGKTRPRIASMALVLRANGARGQVAQDNAHEAKPAHDGQHRKVFAVSRQHILPPVQRLQVINEFARQRQQPARSNRERNDRAVSSTIFLLEDFIFELWISEIFAFSRSKNGRRWPTGRMRAPSLQQFQIPTASSKSPTPALRTSPMQDARERTIIVKGCRPLFRLDTQLWRIAVYSQTTVRCQALFSYKRNFLLTQFSDLPLDATVEAAVLRIFTGPGKLPADAALLHKGEGNAVGVVLAACLEVTKLAEAPALEGSPGKTLPR